MLENLFAKAQLITERQNYRVYCFHTQLFIYKASTIEASKWKQVELWSIKISTLK